VRRSQPALLLVGLVLVLGAAAYAGAGLCARLAPVRRTARAESAEWKDEMVLTGAVLRTEIVIPRRLDRLRFTAPEGVRLAAGEAVAIEFETGVDYFTSALLLRLRRQLAADEAALGRDGRAAGQAQLYRELAGVRAAAALGDVPALLTAGHDAALGLFPQRLTAERLGRLRTEIRALERQGAGERILTAPAAGLFLQHTDGWESLSADGGALTAEELAGVLSAPTRTSFAAGRLITGSAWRLAAFVDPDRASRLVPGDSLELELAGTVLPARVARLSAGADGRAMVVLSCSRGLTEIAGSRVLTVSAVLGRVRGLCLPAEALGRDADGAYVCRSAGPFLRREAVTVLEARDGLVLVSAPGLRPGSEVVLAGGDIPAKTQEDK